MSATVLSFDAAAHEYRMPDGRLVPSVTQILKAVGVAVDFEGLASIGRRVADAIDLKREIGHTLHQDAHAFDDDDLNWSTVDPRVEPYLRAWAAFRENTRLMPVTRERRVLHAALGYAGTLDGIFVAPNGRRVLVDLKTGDPWDAGAHLQTAAYAAGYLCEHPSERIDERWAVRLTPEHGVPYRIVPFTDWRDFSKFQACLTVYHEQATRRRSK